MFVRYFGLQNKPPMGSKKAESEKCFTFHKKYGTRRGFLAVILSLSAS